MIKQDRTKVTTMQSGKTRMCNPYAVDGRCIRRLSTIEQEEKKGDFNTIKRALFTAFATGSFVAYAQFVERRLRPGETVDIFLADLKRISVLFGGKTEQSLKAAFVYELPEHVQHLLRTFSRGEKMDISQLLPEREQ